MVFDYLYKENSAGDVGTLYQLKIRLNRKDVNQMVNKSYHGCESFFNTVVDAYIVFAAMEFFGMSTPDSKPTKSHLFEVSKDVLKRTLNEKLGELVDRYILLEVQPEKSLSQGMEASTQDDLPQLHKCRHPACDKVYVYKKRRDSHENTVHGLIIQDHSETTSPSDPREGDGIFNYSHNILKTGLLLRNFQDAIKEGDGARIEYLWKFMMLLFKVCGKTKYALAEIRLHAQLNALLTPREAHNLRWNRTINRNGGIGKNVAIDQHMEHTIQATKKLISAHGANLTFKSAQVYSQATDAIEEIISNFDRETDIHKASSKHKHEKDGDVLKVVKVLQEIDALKEISGRTHPTIGTIPKDPITALDFNDLNKWINKHKKKWSFKYY